MNETKSNRRDFLVRGATVVAGSLLCSSVVSSIAHGQDHMEGMGQGETNGYVLPSGTTKHCGTCEFWGGPRRISPDKSTITGLGWCNNPNSPSYQKMTTPDHGPMDTWKKWGALG